MLTHTELFINPCNARDIPKVLIDVESKEILA